MKSVFDRFMAWTVDHRGVTFLAVVLISVLSIIGHTRPHLVRQIFVRQQTQGATAKVNNNDDEEWREVPNVDPVSLSDSDAVLVVQSSQFFTPEGAKAMRHVVEQLDELDYVGGILWMDRVPILNIFGLPEPLFPRSEASAERFAAAQNKAMKHPLVGGQLLSEDGKTQLLLVSFDFDFVRSNEQCTIELRTAAEKAAADFPEVPLSFQVTGRLPAYITAMEAHEANQVKYQVIGYSVIFIMAIILFRGIRAVLIVSLAPIVGVIWTLGFLKFFNLQDNPFNDVILPVLVSLVGLTDGVHLMVQLRKLRASGFPERIAARTALHQVGFACMLTSLTTAIGLGSLALAHNIWVQEFGWCSVIGVTLMFVAVVTIIPLVCSTWLGKNIHLGHDKSLIDRNLTRIGELVEFVLKYPRTVSLIGIGLTLACVAVSLTLRPDERRANSLPEHSEAYQALNHMDQVLGGLEFARVDVAWSSVIGDESGEILQVVSEVDDLLHTEPLIGYPLSIRNLVESLPGEGDNDDRMMMLELLPPQLKRAFFTPERRHATVAFRVQDLGIAKFGPVFTRLESGLLQIAAQHREFTLRLEGDAIWRWKNLYQIVVDLAASLGTASVIIFIVLGLAYRSPRIGLISIFPNVFPLAVTGTWLVFAGYNLELVSVCAFTVCLGIAVDDTIHFLSRYDEERQKTDDRQTAIRRAFTGVGVSLVMTTVVLVAGFSTVAFSDSRDHHIFATMGALTIGCALIGDLVILPALISWFGPKQQIGNASATEGKEQTHS
ncbi:MAG TPA: efflux RND transporter permease subunit [Planctomycetaceae bacterium]|nr:efflux RND transporter permease subunit [Planctomycetaceae bacterium]